MENCSGRPLQPTTRKVRTRSPQVIAGILHVLLFHVGNCTYVLNQASGDILMPDYPDGYTGAQECHWHITVTTGSLVGIMFQSLEASALFLLSSIKKTDDSHYLQIDAASTSCLNNYITFYDGVDTSAPVIDTYCGTPGLPNAMASSNKIYAKFSTDGLRPRPNFAARFQEGQINS